jgi:hypothetical protein
MLPEPGTKSGEKAQVYTHYRFRFSNVRMQRILLQCGDFCGGSIERRPSEFRPRIRCEIANAVPEINPVSGSTGPVLDLSIDIQMITFRRRFRVIE